MRRGRRLGLVTPGTTSTGSASAEVVAVPVRESATAAALADWVDDVVAAVETVTEAPCLTDPEHWSDEQLVEACRAGDDAALTCLLTRYRGFARSKARTYFIVGADREDLVQEGMIGLYKAVRDFKPELETSFRAFAELCVTRQIITAIKSATRHKHGPLNSYVSFSRPLSTDDDGERYLADLLPTSPVQDPANLVVSAERIRALQEHVDTVLSDLEVEVLRLYVEGKSYAEIALLLQRHVKSIDNALQRIKRKLDQHLREREAAEAAG